MNTLSTTGGETMAALALLCSLVILTTWLFSLAARVKQLSRLASLATKRAQAPQAWESKLRELAGDLASLSSSFEKLQRDVTRLNSRAGMRELRGRDAQPGAGPPPGTSKAQLRLYYARELAALGSQTPPNSQTRE